MKLLHSYGKRDIIEYDYTLPEMSEYQIKIQTIMTGVCRSDIGSYMGWEDPMPFGRFGHEGLGKVVAIGNQVTCPVKIGDIVSTFSDPAYADYYYANDYDFAIVPEASSKYILQPVACAMNIIDKTLCTSTALGHPDDYEVLLIGTGFMSLVIGQYLNNTSVPLVVVGKSNLDLWKSINVEPKSMDEILKLNKKYKIIIDLTSRAETFDIITDKLADIEALICYAATPYTPVTTNFFKNCWNCHTFIMPSPRNSDFHSIMRWTAQLIEEGIIDPSPLWSKEYSRSNMDGVKQAFEDGVSRPNGYLRGYINWTK